MLVFYPRFSSIDLGFLRGPGPGLGNLLFPLSRSIKYVQQGRGTMIAPTWRNIKVGPILRGEQDFRTYGDLFQHRPLGEIVRGIVQRCNVRRVVGEDDFLDRASEMVSDHGIVLVAGMRGEFADLNGMGHAVQGWLRERSKVPIDAAESEFIGVHVRLGDFGQPAEVGYRRNSQISLQWYKEELIRIRRLIGDLPAKVFTDAPASAVSPIFDDVRLVEFVRPTNALVDMLLLSQARHIVASNSTFSLWAAFMGGGTVSTRFEALFQDYGLTNRDFLRRVL